MIGHSLGSTWRPARRGDLVADAAALVGPARAAVETPPRGGSSRAPRKGSPALLRELLPNAESQLSNRSRQQPGPSASSRGPAARSPGPRGPCRARQSRPVACISPSPPTRPRWSPSSASSGLRGRASPVPPRIPYISNVTGTWMTPADAADPGYWMRHLRQTGAVRGRPSPSSSPRSERIWGPARSGPGRPLHAGDAAPGPARRAGTVLHSLRHPQDRQSDVGFLPRSWARLWLGTAVDGRIYAGERPTALRLPSYPFEMRQLLLDRAAAPELRDLGGPTVAAGPAAGRRRLFGPRLAPGVLAAAGRRMPPILPDAACRLPLNGCVVTRPGRAARRAVARAGHRVAAVTPGGPFTRLARTPATPHRERGDSRPLLRDSRTVGLPTPSRNSGASGGSGGVALADLGFTACSP